MSNLPPRIQAQLDAADTLLAQAQGQGETANPTPAHDAIAEANTVTPAPQPAPAEPQNQPQALQPDPWEHKYRTLQGIHNRHTADLKARLQEQEQLTAQLKAQLEAKTQAPEVTVDPKDAEVFGADMVDMVRRVTLAAYAGVAAQFDQRLTAIEQHLRGTANAVAKTTDEIFMERLLARVPDFEAVNTSEGFLAWLSEIDPIYGAPRQDALTAAGDARDVERVATIFNAYKATLQAQAPAAPATNKLDKQVAPRASAPAAAPVAARNTFTVAEVQAFYRDMQRGVYRGREAEAAAMEQKFNAALAEGRIV